MNEARRSLTSLKPWALAFLITCIALAISLLLGDARNPSRAYLQLCTWDCGWYKSIASTGYHSVIPPVAQNGELSNVAFFPGYPLIARAIYLVFDFSDTRPPLLLTAHLFCVVFWASLLLTFRRWQVHPYIQALGITAIFVHPAGFFLVMGYSESLFLASMLFFFYASDSPHPRTRWLAVIPGFLMTATRIVGLPVVAYPLIRLLAQEGRSSLSPKRWGQPAAIAALSSLGSLLFFAYCQLKFGDYRLYMLTQKIGWGIVPEYSAIFKWHEFKYFAPYEQAATIASGVGFGAVLAGELGWAFLKRKRPHPLRISLTICAFMIFFITLSGLKSLWFRSMIRYTLPWWLIQILCLAELSTHAAFKLPASLAKITLAAGITALAVFCWFHQLPHLFAFLHNRWFA